MDSNVVASSARDESSSRGVRRNGFTPRFAAALHRRKGEDGDGAESEAQRGPTERWPFVLLRFLCRRSSAVRRGRHPGNAAGSLEDAHGKASLLTLSSLLSTQGGISPSSFHAERGVSERCAGFAAKARRRPLKIYGNKRDCAASGRERCRRW